MIPVYFSHVGEILLNSANEPLYVKPGKIQNILAEIEVHYPGFYRGVLDTTGKHFNSATLVFKHIEIDTDGRFLEAAHTKPVSSLNETIADEDENLFIALFHPEHIIQFLLHTLTESEQRFVHASGSKKYSAYINLADKLDVGGRPLFASAEPEPLYPFTNGQPISTLVTDDLIDPTQNKFIPKALQNAITSLWEIDKDSALRLFQEDTLKHILGELAKPDEVEKRPLLLSIPTGGGKTEAFLIPLISHLYNHRERQLRAGRIPTATIRSIVIYPTRALANDQAKRVAEILYQMNKDAIEDRKISVGVLTGDTVTSDYNFSTEKSLLQLCPRCSSVLTDFSQKNISREGKPLTVARCSCGAEIDYFRLTRNDILNYPPDILITSPDMINYMLQSPRYHKHIFSSAIDMLIFDEIHMYSSVFGCNVAHLLRRFEEACHRKPLYVGMSATIRNAKHLACLIFNTDLKKVCYLRPCRKNEVADEEKRAYLNYALPPERYRYHYALTPIRVLNNYHQKVTTSVLSIADAIGHILRDPHFRKTLIFANFRQDTDDVLRFLRDREDRYFTPYQQTILPRILAQQSMPEATQNFTFSKVELDVISAIGRWYQLAQKQGMLYTANLEIGWHRGGLERDERIKAVNRFATKSRLNMPGEDHAELPIDIMVATSTLELGIDIGDVTTVINCGAPFTANEYTQRIGRGGRRKDAMALTVIDTRNPLDFYFLKHFKEYAHPTPETFEDAPIIISNSEVTKSHIYARLLDRLAAYLGDTSKNEIQVSDLQEMSLHSNGLVVTFGDNWKFFSETLFNEIFTPAVVLNLQTWLKREAQIIPDIHEAALSLQDIQGLWMAKCKQLYERFKDGKLREIDELSGMKTKDRELVPDLRSSGPSVGMYLVREAQAEDQPQDAISRRQAINSRPVGGYASQGSVTYRIESIKENDHDTERRIKELLYDTEPAIRYFHTMFGDETNKSPFPDNPRDVLINVQLETPQDLSVKYNPYRFYCPRCGATYSDKRPGDDSCNYCYGPLRQLAEVYMCGGCGELFLPPVPKVCVNPDCIALTKSIKDKTPFMPDGYKRIGKHDRHNDYFRFTALPMLHWQCRACKTVINYHAFYELPPIIQAQIKRATFGKDTPDQIANRFLYKPESFFSKIYEADGFHKARFTCDKCKKDNKYKKIFVKNIPSYRSMVQEYIHAKKHITPELSTSIGTLHFRQVDTIALVREYFRRFYSYRDGDYSIELKPIFTDNNKYLANLYTAHAVFFRFHTTLDLFLNTDTASHCRLGKDCACRTHISASSEDDNNYEENDQTSPTPYLLTWEKLRKPDPRRKWCDIVQGKIVGKKCPGPDTPCDTCSYFDFKRYQRYLIIHTLEHAIITAMPKYTGINKNQIRGTIFPNDEPDYDLVLVDTIEGGSGSMYLLRQNWTQVWKVVGELLEEAQNERGQLVLPYTCSRYNHDLCPDLAYKFYQYVNQSGGL